MDFRETISSYREKAGWTKKKLAELVGVTQPYIVQIENDGKVPSDAVVLRLADCLGSTGVNCSSPPIAHAPPRTSRSASRRCSKSWCRARRSISPSSTRAAATWSRPISSCATSGRPWAVDSRSR
ncbi:MAG: helix-turn-helix transcriptional regulator [Acidobacteria bacterium]|nr:helix-turn-helix transcriptional regulator [Acidobacteriota bacterium]